MIYGNKIRLRAIERDDIPRFVKWFNDPEVRYFLSTVRPLNRMAERSFLEEFSKGAKDPSADIILAIVLKEEDRHIGNAGLHNINLIDRVAEFGIGIGEKDCWQKGYGTEATRAMVQYGFDTLNLHRIYLRVHDYNTRGLATYKKVGFRQEGVMRQALFRQGRYHDVIFMGILKDEYRP